MDDDFLAQVAASGFTYLSIDIARGVSITGWHKNDRKTFSGKGRTLPEAAQKLFAEQRKSAATGAIFGDLLG